MHAGVRRPPATLTPRHLTALYVQHRVSTVVCAAV
jgi:hypothetical protein